MAVFKRFDFSEEPGRFRWYLRPVAAAIALPAWLKYRPRINYSGGIENIEGPFLLLCNHNAFLDFKICYRLLGRRYANFVVAIDGYIGRVGLMKKVGCICKRKFTNDIALVRNLMKVVKRGDIPVLYPEARYSLCGTTAVLPRSLGKMVKLMGVPVAVLICHGHHVNSPFWDSSHERGIPYDEADYSLLLTKEDVKNLSMDEINDRIVRAFQYDDFMWQKEKGIRINDKKRAEGLHKVLYQCPGCGTEYRMDSRGDTLFCTECQRKWRMKEDGSLEALEGKTEFSHIPDWYEWERNNVKKEVREGRYSSGSLRVSVDSLPDGRRFRHMGKGVLIHDGDGFSAVLDNPPEGETASISLRPQDTYSVHIEYRYLFKHGDCVDLNTPKDTWYIYPEGRDFSVTKMALATEELYFWEKEKEGKPCPPGLA